MLVLIKTGGECEGEDGTRAKGIEQMQRVIRSDGAVRRGHEGENWQTNHRSTLTGRGGMDEDERRGMKDRNRKGGMTESCRMLDWIRLDECLMIPTGRRAG